MRIALVGKFPPVEGGVSANMYRTAHTLADRGHDVHVITNSSEVEGGYREFFWGDDGTKAGTTFYREGRVTVHNIEPIESESYVPWASPYLSRLIGLTLKTIKEHSIDIVFGMYFEPYAMAAGIAATATRTPLVIRHAGSDLGRLSHHSNLREAYSWLVSQAHTVITTKNSVHELRGLAGSPSYPVRYLTGAALPEFFTDRGAALDLEDLLPQLEPWYASLPAPTETRKRLRYMNTSVGERKGPVIGVYGKVGTTKGSFLLLQALDSLARAGHDFTFLSIAGGRPAALNRYFDALSDYAELSRRTHILPFLAPWRIPEFLRLCTIVCMLEHNFPITFHLPRIPREVLSTGPALVCSGEVAHKQPFWPNLVDGKNFVLIDNPPDTELLATRLSELIADPAACRSIGRHGVFLSRVFENGLRSVDGTALVIESCRDRVV